MPVKLRLARHGRKKFAFYHIVAADGRAPRDGKFIEKLGIYNPNTNPATIELDFDKSLNWLENGAQPTETVRAILSYRGVLMKKHLLEGARKGAFSVEEAETRFAAWMKEKEAKIQAKKDGLDKAIEEDIKQRLEAESKISEARAAEILKKKSELAEAADKEARAAVGEPEEELEVAAEAVAEASADKAEDTDAAVDEGKEEEKPAEQAVAEEEVEKQEAAVEEGKEEEKPAEQAVAEEVVEKQEAESKEEEKPAEEEVEEADQKQAEVTPKDSKKSGKEKSE